MNSRGAWWCPQKIAVVGGWRGTTRAVVRSPARQLGTTREVVPRYRGLGGYYLPGSTAQRSAAPRAAREHRRVRAVCGAPRW